MNELRHDCEIISHIGVIGSGKDFHAMELINNYGILLQNDLNHEYKFHYLND
jgi:hypothetical protein